MNALIVLHHVTLIDGTGKEPLPDATVAVRGREIIYAGPARTWQPSLHEDILNIDLAGKYVLPGLIDCHVHLAGSGEPDGRFGASDGSMALKILKNARRNLAAGITTVRDLGGWNEVEFEVRRSIQAGEFSGPRMILAGRFISISESGADHYKGMYCIADGVEAVRKAVRQQIRHGADLVKLGVTGAVLVEDGVPGATHFNLDEIRVAVEEAAKFGRRVAAHAHGIDGIRQAVSAGVHSIEHGTYLYQGARRHRGDEAQRHISCAHPQGGPRCAQAGGLRGSGVDRRQDARNPGCGQEIRARGPSRPASRSQWAAMPPRRSTIMVRMHWKSYWMQQAGMKPMEALTAATLGVCQGAGRRVLAWLRRSRQGRRSAGHGRRSTRGSQTAR